jgi:hypothetical protein
MVHQPPHAADLQRWAGSKDVAISHRLHCCWYWLGLVFGDLRIALVLLYFFVGI